MNHRQQAIERVRAHLFAYSRAPRGTPDHHRLIYRNADRRIALYGESHLTFADLKVLLSTVDETRAVLEDAIKTLSKLAEAFSEAAE